MSGLDALLVLMVVSGVVAGALVALKFAPR